MDRFIFTSAFIIIFLSYIISVVILYGIQPSVSKSYYKLKHKLIFTLFCWSISIFYLLSSPTVLSFLAVTGIIVVGTTPMVLIPNIKRVHMVGAIMGIAFSQLSILIDSQQYICFAGFFVACAPFLIIKKIKKNVFWWIEIIAMLNVTLANYLTLNIN